jgi:hypothetical protein
MKKIIYARKKKNKQYFSEITEEAISPPKVITAYIQRMKEKENAPISHNWDFADNLNNSKSENKTN